MKALDEDHARGQYLRSWFDHEILQSIESVRRKIEEAAGDVSPVFLSIASNLLRDYSRQDPKDLRIRRRKSPLPGTAFANAFVVAGREVHRARRSNSRGSRNAPLAWSRLPIRRSHPGRARDLRCGHHKPAIRNGASVHRHTAPIAGLAGFSGTGTHCRGLRPS